MTYHTANRVLSSKLATPEKKFTYKNTTTKTLFVNKFDLLPDANFVKHGKAYVTKNGVTVFSSDRENEPLKKYSQFPIREKLLFLQRDEEFEIFVYSDNADSKVDLGISVELDYENIPLPSTMVPYVVDPFSLDSEFLNMFEKQSRLPNHDESELLYMQGYKNLTVTITVYPTERPTTQTHPQAVDSSPSTWSTVDTSGADFDWGSSKQRNVRALTTIGFSSIVVSFYTRNDPADPWVLATSRTGTTGVIVPTTFSTSDRYLRIVPSSHTVSVYDILDADTGGGTGTVALETKNSSGQWVNFITVATFGAGSQTISKQYGALVSGDIIPNTPDRLRIRHTVDSSGGLVSEVDIEKDP